MGKDTKLYALTQQERDILREMVKEYRGRRHNTPTRAQTADSSQAPEVYIAKVPSAGIPALTVVSGTIQPGSVLCSLYNVNNYNFLDSGGPQTLSAMLAGSTAIQKLVFNLGASAIAGGSNVFIPVVRDKWGSWIANPQTPNVLNFINADPNSATMGLHGVMQIIGSQVIGTTSYLKVQKPGIGYSNSTKIPTIRAWGSEFVFNTSPGSVTIGNKGTCEFASSSPDFPTVAAYDTTLTAPSVGEIWGPGADGTLKRGVGGYLITQIETGTGTGTGTGTHGTATIKVIACHEMSSPTYGTLPPTTTSNGSTIPAFSAVGVNAGQVLAGFFEPLLSKGPGFPVSNPWNAQQTPDPLAIAWGLISGAQSQTYSTSTGFEHGRTLDGFSQPIPVYSHATASPEIGEVCGPIPGTSGSDVNQFLFGKGLPGWRCVAKLASTPDPIILVVRDHITSQWLAVASADNVIPSGAKGGAWYGNNGGVNTGGGTDFVCYVLAYPIADSPSSGGTNTSLSVPSQAYDGTNGYPTITPFAVLLPRIGARDPNIHKGDVFSYAACGVVNGITATSGYSRWFGAQPTSWSGGAIAVGEYLDDGIGTIKAFTSTTGIPPRGWWWCDGTNGTQNLKGKVLYGNPSMGSGGGTAPTVGNGGTAQSIQSVNYIQRIN